MMRHFFTFARINKIGLEGDSRHDAMCALQMHITNWVVLVSQFVAQLAHVVNCGWWISVPTWTYYHLSTNHNSLHRRILAPNFFLQILLFYYLFLVWAKSHSILLSIPSYFPETVFGEKGMTRKQKKEPKKRDGYYKESRTAISRDVANKL